MVLGVAPLRVDAAAAVLRLHAENARRAPHALLAADAGRLVLQRSRPAAEGLLPGGLFAEGR